MSVASISHSIQSIGFLTEIRESEDVYPIIMATHLASIALFGGMILMTDLRLLGLAMTEISVTDVVGQLRVWKRVGFVIMVTMGLLLATSEMDKYYANPYFQLKMFLLLMVGVHAIVFRRRVYGNTQALDRAPKMPRIARVAAISSLVLWIGILSAGRWIAYFEQPKDGGPASQSARPGARIAANRRLPLSRSARDSGFSLVVQ